MTLTPEAVTDQAQAGPAAAPTWSHRAAAWGPHRCTRGHQSSQIQSLSTGSRSVASAGPRPGRERQGSGLDLEAHQTSPGDNTQHRRPWSPERGSIVSQVAQQSAAPMPVGPSGAMTEQPGGAGKPRSSWEQGFLCQNQLLSEPQLLLRREGRCRQPQKVAQRRGGSLGCTQVLPGWVSQTGSSGCWKSRMQRSQN